MAIKGDLPIDLFWTLNDVPIVSDAGGQGVSVQRLNARTSALSIDALGAQHRGVYQCVARNRAGFSVVSSELTVNGRDEFEFSFFMFCVLFLCFLVPKIPLNSTINKKGASSDNGTSLSISVKIFARVLIILLNKYLINKMKS